MGLDRSDLRDLSRLLSLVLRHKPETLGLQLDPAGWVGIPVLIAALRQADRRWGTVGLGDLEAVAGAFDKKRHEIADGRIRAAYGHSIQVEAAPAPSVPPDLLYHGTSPDAAGAILRDGLRPMSRQRVHLSTDTATAIEVGRRKSDNPVILIVRATAAHGSGILFYEVDRRIWQADAIPPQYIAAT